MNIWKDKKTGRYFVRVKHQGQYHSLGNGYDRKDEAEEADVLLKRLLRQGKILTAQGTFYEAWGEYLNYAKTTVRWFMKGGDTGWLRGVFRC